MLRQLARLFSVGDAAGVAEIDPRQTDRVQCVRRRRDVAQLFRDRERLTRQWEGRLGIANADLDSTRLLRERSSGRGRQWSPPRELDRMPPREPGSLRLAAVKEDA